MGNDFAEFGGSLDCYTLEFHPENIPKPDTLMIFMTRGGKRIADDLRSAFGGFRRVVVVVDGDRYEFDADAFIGLLEDFEKGMR